MPADGTEEYRLLHVQYMPHDLYVHIHVYTCTCIFLKPLLRLFFKPLRLCTF